MTTSETLKDGLAIRRDGWPSNFQLPIVAFVDLESNIRETGVINHGLCPALRQDGRATSRQAETLVPRT